MLVLVTLIADIGLRFVPPGRVYFHAWEAATMHATADGSFTPNFRYENNHASGDLANMGNLPQFRHYHQEVFTTDKFGFRNPPREGADGAPSAILVGDSFSVGSGNSDGDTLTAQLTSRLPNGRVYNGANTGPHWIMVNELISRLHMRGGLVIWQMSERQKLPASLQAEGPYTLPSASSALGDRRSIVQRFSDWRDSLLAYSPLRIYLSGAYRRLENGVLFPNPSENLVMVGHLRNGDSMLFLKTEVDNFYQPRYDSPTYLTEINALIHCTGNDLLVVLVPDKFGVYYPLLQDNLPSPPEGKSHLDKLEEDLHRSGVPVVNLMGPLRSQASEGLQKREYNYRLDDTHWNPAGIQTAATEILRVWSNRPKNSGNTSISPNSCPTVQ
jgi:hypothetical protein